VQGAMMGMPPPAFGPPQGFNQGFDPNAMQQQPMQGFDPNHPPYGAPQGYPNPGASGAYGAMGPGQPGMLPQGPMGTGGYGSMTPQGVQQQNPPPAAGMQQLIAKLKENSIPKIVAGLLFIIGGILYLSEDDSPAPKPKPVAALDGGSPAAAGGGTSSAPLVSPPVMPPPPVLPAWPAGVPCPPANWPPDTPLPCVPNGLAAQTDPAPVRPKEAGAPVFAGGSKTLERQAVDLVASGETAKAAAAYEELVRREPNNKVYAEAARILRAKLDAGP